uniref:Uncharacterized protein n=1 Tax=Hyaloperonospora arabidopsidis (strain Emoy2) TaxID=559515 RepID=M4BSD9_HYAAE
MDRQKAQAYADLAAQMMELHTSIALLAQNVEKMAKTDEEVTAMTCIFNGVYGNGARGSVAWKTEELTIAMMMTMSCRFKNAAQQTNYRDPSPSA